MKDKRKLFIFLFILGAVLVGLILLPDLKRTPEERAARALAKKEARARGWTIVLVTSAKEVTNRWIIDIKQFPNHFGGHASVEIIDGKVVKYRPGK